MFSRSIALILALAFTVACNAQSTVVATAGMLIQKNQFDAANHYLDSILKKDKKNVDALMMKGNVILNRKWNEIPTPLVISAENEAIFDTAISSMALLPPVIPAATEKEVEKIWKKCLALNPARLDIKKGLCSLYALSLDKEKLKAGIKELMKAVPDSTGEQAYNLAEYARKIKERSRFEDAMEVYHFIAQQYPELGGIRADIAAEYFYTGRMKEALNWLDSALRKKNIDETTFLNSAFIYSQLAYYDNSQLTLERYDREFQNKLGDFYTALRLFSDSDSRYARKLEAFIQATDSNSYYDEHTLAKLLLTYSDSFSVDDFKALTVSGLPDWYAPLIMERGVRQFRSNCEPFVIYGIYCSRIKNYSAAVQLLEEGENCRMDARQTEYWMLQYGYALFMQGETEKALLYFNPLKQTGSSFYYRQAAQYFSAKCKLATDKVAAQNELQVLSAESNKTKYALLATELLNQLKP